MSDYRSFLLNLPKASYFIYFVLFLLNYFYTCPFFRRKNIYHGRGKSQSHNRAHQALLLLHSAFAFHVDTCRHSYICTKVYKVAAQSEVTAQQSYLTLFGLLICNKNITVFLFFCIDIPFLFLHLLLSFFLLSWCGCGFVWCYPVCFSVEVLLALLPSLLTHLQTVCTQVGNYQSNQQLPAT